MYLPFQTMSAWKMFKNQYPHAELSRFTQKDWYGDDTNNIYFKDGEEKIQVFGRGKFIYGSFTREFKKALGFPAVSAMNVTHHEVINLSNFPQELTLNLKPKLPVPALGHADTPLPFDFSNLKIFVTSTDFFKMKFRDVFTDTKLTHHSAKESYRWLNSPDMNYWPQQLNFSVWCATTGCGISSKFLFEDKIKENELNLPKQVRSFLWFHVYFTIRRVLHELGGIQNFVALPVDDTFDQQNNTYDIPSYNRLCNEFGISPSTDFMVWVTCTSTTPVGDMIRHVQKLLILENTSSVMKVGQLVMAT